MRRAALWMAMLACGCRHESAQVSERHDRIALVDPSDGAPVDAVIREFQKSARRDPDKVDYWIGLGQSWVRKARERSDPSYYLNAGAAAKVAEQLSPGLPLALDLEALVLLSDHRFKEAAAVARRVIAARPDDQQAHGLLSDALLELGDADGAMAEAQRMVSLKPTLASYSRAAHLRWLQGDAQGAKAAWRLAIDAGASAHDPEPRAWALVQAAMLFYSEGDYAGAGAGFDVALRSIADYAPALVGQGRVALAQGDGKRAAELLSRAFSANPLIETAWLLGDARALAGDSAGAAEAFRYVRSRGARLDPRTLSLYLSSTKAGPEDTAEALRLALEEKTVRDDLYTEDALAWALYRNGRFAEARVAADRATQLGTRDPRLLYHAGAIRLAAGEAEEGRALIRSALELSPAFDRAAVVEARALLAR